MPRKQWAYRPTDEEHEKLMKAMREQSEYTSVAQFVREGVLRLVHSEDRQKLYTEIDEMIEDLNLWFLEDPIQPEDASGSLRLTQECSVPILTGENLYSRHGFKPYIENQACDMVHPDPQKCGGLLETKKIAGTPRVHKKSVNGTPTSAQKKLPAAFWHIRQWQTCGSCSESARKRMAPHWQPPYIGSFSGSFIVQSRFT